MELVHVNPWSLAGDLHREMNNLFKRHYYPHDKTGSSVVTSHWTPAVDIREEVEQLVLLMDIPGMTAKDIDIQIDKGVLTVKGERKVEHDAKTEYRDVQSERPVGEFIRRFTLPDSADSEHIAARAKNGVLEILIAKTQSATPKKINVEE